ncbi:hypothetical protein GJAV_G00254050 [Gymnothorax javanicus]|nr:hypothetical protein GJAV_G00254050 [Gymnothorax javanicus]
MDNMAPYTLLLLLALVTGTHQMKEGDLAGGHMTYKARATPENFMVDLYFKESKFGSCNLESNWECNSDDCGTIVSTNIQESFTTDGFCQSIGILTVALPLPKSFLMKNEKCCWVASVHPDIHNQQLLTTVELRSRSDTKDVNKPPLFTVLPAFRFSANCQNTIRLLQHDQDGDRVKCSLDTNSCTVCAEHTGFFVDEDACEIHSSGEAILGDHLFEMVVQDFPQQAITLTDSNGEEMVIQPSMPISHLPLRFVVQVVRGAVVCQAKAELPELDDPTPVHGTVLKATAGKPLEIKAHFTAEYSNPAGYEISGPLNMETIVAGNQADVTIKWTPNEQQIGDHIPICIAPKVSSFGTYQGDMRCFIIDVEADEEDQDAESQDDAAGGQSEDDAAGGQSQDDAAGGQSQDDAAGRQSQDDAAGGQSQDDAAGGQSQDDAAGGQSQDDAAGGQSQDDAADEENQGDKKVVCSSTSMMIKVALSLFGGFDGHTIILNDQSCPATISDTQVTATTSLDACGTEFDEDNDNVIFRNSISFAPERGVISRTDDVKIQFSCTYPKTEIVSTLFKALRLSEVFDEDGFGKFSFQFAFFDSSTFETKVDTNTKPLEVNMREMIFMQIKATAAANTMLFVESCRATPEDNPEHETSYSIIENGCIMDSTVQEFESQSREYRIGIKAFRFIGEHDEVLFSCSVMLCITGKKGTRCTQGCIESNERRKRSVAGETARHNVVQGPLRLKRSADDKGLSVFSAPSVTINMNLFCVTVLVAVALVCSVVAYKIKKSHNGYEELPVTDF